LWVAEGLTSYFGDLLAARSGVGTLNDYLAIDSRHITDLQTKQPGRLAQTLDRPRRRCSSGFRRNARWTTNVKGPVVGLVLDAHIRHHTNDRRSMDDVMRLEYRRWSGGRGYSAADFSQTMPDAAGFDVGPLLHTLVATTEEIDYTEMLDWCGLRFARSEDPARAWTQEVRPDATAPQKAHLASLVAHSNR
jgi:predicted metalloprotease with PDZ domain